MKNEKMNYEMNVVIYDPETPEGMTSDLYFKLDVVFFHSDNSYGNGYHVAIKGKELPFGKEMIDLRYDKSFKRDNKEEWLIKWAQSYWSGRNGAYAVKSIEVN